MVKDGGDNEVATVEVKTVAISHADNWSSRTKYVRSGGRQEGNCEQKSMSVTCARTRASTSATI